MAHGPWAMGRFLPVKPRWFQYGKSMGRFIKIKGGWSSIAVYSNTWAEGTFSASGWRHAQCGLSLGKGVATKCIGLSGYGRAGECFFIKNQTVPNFHTTTFETCFITCSFHNVWHSTFHHNMFHNMFSDNDIILCYIFHNMFRNMFTMQIYVCEKWANVVVQFWANFKTHRHKHNNSVKKHSPCIPTRTVDTSKRGHGTSAPTPPQLR